jgi:nifR3 family TIM-barrel protein
MAGYTDAPFRLLCHEFGADFAVTEMISADGLVRDSGKTRMLLGRMDGEGPVGIQLFGSDPETMAAAAGIAEAEAPAFIDLNFGCPVRKVVRKNGGAAIMRNLRLMERISTAVAKRVSIPVTAKIRSGWNRSEENFIEAGRILEGSGLAAVTIHPRYRSQGFGGDADWEHVARLSRALSIPVISSGDVLDANDYETVREGTGCGAVMIGRGAIGRPWIFKRIKDRIEGRDEGAVALPNRTAIIKRHVEMAVEWKGERVGILEMRKHYRWYLRGLPAVRDARRRLSAARSLDEVVNILNDIEKESARTWKRPA